MHPEVVTEIPGPKSTRLAAELRRHESRNVTYLSKEWPVFWERAEGVNVWDVDGNRFLDLTSAFAVAGLGHGRAELVHALTTQAGTLLHGMGDVHPTRLKVDLCAQLSALTYERWGAGEGKTVLSNSGFEAVETALKTAHLATNRRGVLAFEGGYHGLGYGALLPAGFDKFRAPFASQLADLTTLLPFPDSEGDLGATRARLAQLDASEIGVLMVEPIQGRGGIVIPPAGFLSLLRDWCDAHGVILVFDEILTGFYRTGALFACDHEGVVPDLICLGKALSGGFPISACVGKASVMDAWPVSAGEALHTSTFLGHPVGCAMALEALRLHQDPATLAAVQSVARTLGEGLQVLQMPGTSEIRGQGALWGLVFEDGAEANRVVLAMLQAGYLLLAGGPGGAVVTFTPPFEIAEDEIGSCLETLLGI
ncbi:MAG: aspartate aminotransferase family protein [Akkermansiaceae bacterium]